MSCLGLDEDLSKQQGNREYFDCLFRAVSVWLSCASSHSAKAAVHQDEVADTAIVRMDLMALQR